MPLMVLFGSLHRQWFGDKKQSANHAQSSDGSNLNQRERGHKSLENCRNVVLHHVVSADALKDVRHSLHASRDCNVLRDHQIQDNRRATSLLLWRSFRGRVYGGRRKLSNAMGQIGAVGLTSADANIQRRPRLAIMAD
jgi:hypothetical protein